MVKAVTQDQREFVYRLSLGLSRSTVDELDGSIHSFIAELGDRLDADRSYLIMFDEATQTISITHEACRSGVIPQRDAVQNVPMARFPWLMDQLQTLSMLVIPEVQELPPDAEEEKLEFQRESIRSLVLVGLRLEGQVRGILGFDYLDQSRVLDSETEEFVLQVGEVLGASVHRQILAGRNVRFENSLYRYSDELW